MNIDRIENISIGELKELFAVNEMSIKGAMRICALFEINTNLPISRR